MKRLNVIPDNDGKVKMVVDGKEVCRMGDSFVVDRSFFNGIAVHELPPKCELNLVEKVENDKISFGFPDIEIIKVSNLRVKVVLSYNTNQEEWIENMGRSLLMIEILHRVAERINGTMDNFAFELEEPDYFEHRWYQSFECELLIESEYLDQCIEEIDSIIERIEKPVEAAMAGVEEAIKTEIARVSDF